MIAGSTESRCTGRASFTTKDIHSQACLPCYVPTTFCAPSHTLPMPGTLSTHVSCAAFSLQSHMSAFWPQRPEFVLAKGWILQQADAR